MEHIIVEKRQVRETHPQLCTTPELSAYLLEGFSRKKLESFLEDPKLALASHRKKRIFCNPHDAMLFNWIAQFYAKFINTYISAYTTTHNTAANAAPGSDLSLTTGGYNAGEGGPGINLGSGTQTVTATLYKLNSYITNGVAAGNLWYGTTDTNIVVNSSTATILQISRVFVNTTANQITATECSLQGFNSGVIATYSIMLYYDTGFSVPIAAGAGAVFCYRFIL